jgi:hypothetical protein
LIAGTAIVCYDTKKGGEGMSWRINALDAYNSEMILDNGIRIGTYKGEEKMSYSLSMPTLKEYFALLEYLKRVFHRKQLSPFYQTDGIWEEEIHCWITENLQARYDLDTEKAYLSIDGAPKMDWFYDEIVAGFYDAPERAGF